MKLSLRIILLFLFSGAFFNGYPQSNKTWFKISEVGPKVWLIDDHGTANIYVVEGGEKALIVDTGMGSADLVKAIRKVTNKPLVVFNTHGHPDHSGANYQFEKVFIHEADMDAAKLFASKEQREQMGAAMLGGQKPGSEEQYNGKIYDTELIPVADGVVFDLGNRKIEVVETPGHTRGSISLLDIKNKLLFSGDNNNSLVWLFLDGCLPLSEYLKTLEMQVSRLAEFDTLYPGHGPAMPSAFIKDQVQCVKSVLDGSCKSELYESFAGNAQKCFFGKASVAFNPNNL